MTVIVDITADAQTEYEQCMEQYWRCWHDVLMYGRWQSAYMRRCLERSAGFDDVACDDMERASVLAEMERAGWRYRALLAKSRS